MHSLMKSLLFSLGLLSATVLQAETLNMPDAVPQEMTIQVPGRGMTMTAVEEKFGTPVTKYDEVGDPPITRWDYPEFSVYFEYQYVLHTVVHKM
jgi:hypothetical protein